MHLDSRVSIYSTSPYLLHKVLKTTTSSSFSLAVSFYQLLEFGIPFRPDGLDFLLVWTCCNLLDFKVFKFSTRKVEVKKFWILVLLGEMISKRTEKRSVCCIFWPAFGCCTLQSLVEIVISAFFVLKSWKSTKNSKFRVKFSKTTFYFVSTQTLVNSFIPGKSTFSYSFRGKNMIQIQKAMKNTLK